jgi:Fic family protein
LRGTVVNGPHQRHVDGLVDVIADATTASDAPLTDERLFRWQAALFPEGHSGIHKIAVGRYRDHADAMQIVSGLPGKERVHYEAVPSANVPQEMRRFLAWFEATATGQQHTLIRAALAHLWFESIHPFEDGNGRLGRAIVDTVLAQGSRSPLRLISLSTQLLATRREYYDALNAAQRPRVTKGANGTKGAEPNDITAWVQWFVGAYTLACAHTNGVMDNALAKARFWASHAGSALNDRQRKVLQRLLDAGDGGFLGGLTADKYTQITGASKATATRDLVDLLAGGHLRVAGQGRATRYGINVPEWSHAAADIGC